MPRNQIIILTSSVLVLVLVISGGFYLKNNFDFTPKNLLTNQNQTQQILSNSQINSADSSVSSLVANQNLTTPSTQKVASTTPTQPNQTALQKPTTPTNTQPLTLTTNTTNKLEGKYEKINQDLGIFKEDIPDQSSEGKVRKAEYYKAGKIITGKYAGYDRIIMTVPISVIDQKDKTRNVLLTKDYKTYIEEIGIESAPLLPGDDGSYSLFNKSKIASREVDTGTNLSASIDIGNGLQLVRSTNQMAPDLSKLKLIKEFGSLKFYDGGSQSAMMPNGDPSSSINNLGTNKSFWVGDETGLVLQYSLTFGNKVNNYADAEAKYQIAIKKYDEEQQRYSSILEVITNEEPSCKGQNTEDYEKCRLVTTPKIEAKFGGKQPTYPDYGHNLSYEFSSKNIQGASDIGKFAGDYGNFMVTACGQFGEPFYAKSEPVNPTEIGKIYGQTPVYVTADQSYAKAHYQAKYGNITDVESRKSMEMAMEKKIPTEQEYLAQNNILWFQDGLGGWIVVADHTKGLGGCGKPVVYLYPEVATDISVRFGESVESKMQLDVQVPNYANNNNKGWLVNAKPNGQLTDLQPKLTNCSDYLNGKKGQEYAVTSCQNNDYPYIYWAGNTPNQYPKINSGFVEAKDNLEQELRNKLVIVGLNQKETNDMLEYWLPQILNKNKPFYRFSLLQNNELDKLFPMTINPKPQSSIRVFLDWDALDTNVSVPTQQLISYPRIGYTMVEWGGIKK